MRAIITGRQEGKTSKLLKWIEHHNNRYILTMSPRERDRLRTLCLGHKNKQIYCYAEWKDIERGLGNDIEVAIDNADHILQALFRGRLDIVTMTGEQE